MDRKTFVELMEYLERERIYRTDLFKSHHISEYRDLYRIISNMSSGYIRHSRNIDIENNREEDLEYIKSILRALRLSNDLAEETGIIDIIEEFEEIIIEGMELEDIPPHDIEALEQLGERNPKGALLAAFRKIKHRKSLSKHENKETEIRSRLHKLERELSDIENKQEIPKFQEFGIESKPKRRWFKGIGKVAQGTALTLADVGLAAGILVLPVDPATQTWGAIVSSVTGIGTALDGAGELRGE